MNLGVVNRKKDCASRPDDPVNPVRIKILEELTLLQIRHPPVSPPDTNRSMGHTVDRMEGHRLQFSLHSDILIHTFLLKFNWPGADHY